MAVRHMRLIMGLFFLIAAIGLLVLRFAMPEVGAKFNTPTRLLIGGLLALMLAGLNLAKWYAGWLWYQQQATPVRQPFQPDPTASHEDEPNPAFDFSKKDATQEKPAQ
jgi:hypothetical protein